MWKCPKCGRIFEREGQMHSCNKVPLEEHFKNKDEAKTLFDYLVKIINTEIGHTEIISLPCCIHLFGKYDFIAILPKKYGLEIRFSLDRQLKNPRIIQVVPLSSKSFKNCLKIESTKEIDSELIDWLRESYLGV